MPLKFSKCFRLQHRFTFIPASFLLLHLFKIIKRESTARNISRFICFPSYSEKQRVMKLVHNERMLLSTVATLDAVGQPVWAKLKP